MRVRPYRISFLLVVVCLAGQSAEVTLKSVFTSSGLTVPLVLRFAPMGGSVSALQFDLDCGPTPALTADNGEAALTAGKSLHSASVSARRVRFLAAGMNRTPIGEGDLITIHTSVRADMAPGVYLFRLENMTAAVGDGNEVPLVKINGGLTIAPAEMRSSNGVFAQVASGGGWKTTISLLNRTEEPQSAKLTFWDETGAALPRPLSFVPETGFAPATSSAVEVLIPENGLVSMDSEIPQSEAAIAGWARIEAPAGVVGSATFRYRLQEGRETDALVPMETRAPYAFVLPFDHLAGFASGIAITNHSDTTSAEVVVIVRDTTGRPLISDVLHLPIGGHDFFNLAARYPSLGSSRGSAECRETNGGNIAVLGLRFNPAGSLTSVSSETK